MKRDLVLRNRRRPRTIDPADVGLPRGWKRYRGPGQSTSTLTLSVLQPRLRLMIAATTSHASDLEAVDFPRGSIKCQSLHRRNELPLPSSSMVPSGGIVARDGTSSTSRRLFVVLRTTPARRSSAVRVSSASMITERTTPANPSRLRWPENVIGWLTTGNHPSSFSILPAFAVVLKSTTLA